MALGYAGVALAVLALMLPSVLVMKSRKQHPDAAWQVAEGPGGDLAVGEAGGHLLGGAVDAGALFVWCVDDAGDLVGDEVEPVFEGDAHGGVVGGSSEPPVDVGDRPAIEGGGEE